jgi:hypothetical protein
VLSGLHRLRFGDGSSSKLLQTAPLPMHELHQRPFFIRVLVPTGDPDGLRIVEKSNWPGVGVVFNRTNYKEVVNRGEFDKTGVYVLVGTSDDSILPAIYVGEGDPVKNRLNQHYSKKDFWDWAVFFVAKDDSLNKAHVQHLEAELLRLAREAKQCKLDNGQGAVVPTLSEAELALAESFLHDILSIFPLLGLGVFEKTVTTAKKSNDLLTIDSKGVKAAGYEDAKGFVVVKGSQLVKTETNTGLCPVKRPSDRSRSTALHFETRWSRHGSLLRKAGWPNDRSRF